MSQSIVLASDLNGRYGSEVYSKRVKNAVARIIEIQPDLVAITGDMVAGQRTPKLSSDHVQKMWSEFNRAVANPISQAGIPLAVTPGNHDASGFPGFEAERTQYEHQWEGRRPELRFTDEDAWPWHYAIWLGQVLLISFDGTVPGSIPAQSLEFIRNTLADNRQEAEHVVVISHLPMWPLAEGRESEIINDRALLDLLHEYEVEVYASGHHHLFYSGEDDHGMLHISVGALGGGTRKFSGESVRQPASFIILELNEEGIVVNALPEPDFNAPMKYSQLPEVISGPFGILTRTQKLNRDTFQEEDS